MLVGKAVHVEHRPTTGALARAMHEGGDDAALIVVGQLDGLGRVGGTEDIGLRAGHGPDSCSPTRIGDLGASFLNDSREGGWVVDMQQIDPPSMLPLGRASCRERVCQTV